jgi:beta-galactosidase
MPMMIGFTLTAGTIMATLSAAGEGARVDMTQYPPAIIANGESLLPYAYVSSYGETAYYREAAEAGIRVFMFPAFLGDRGINSRSGIGPFRPAIWRGESEFDFSSITRDFDSLLEGAPDARVILRLYLDAPSWWEASHPEACTQLPDGTTFRQSFSSTVWREHTGQALRECVRWLLQSKYAPNLIGIHVSAGQTHEWFYHYGKFFHDENPVRTEAFRQWLRTRYGGDQEKFRASWDEPDVDFATARPADISGAGQTRAWRDPGTASPVIDTFQFHSETIVDCIAHFARIVKEESANRLLVGAFYGYHYFVTDARHGHGALARLLECPDVDYLSSPNSYNRSLGQDWPPMAAVQSVQGHGKLWIAENDTRTAKTTLLKDRAPEVCPPGAYGGGVWLGPESMDDSVALLRKDTARMLADGYGGWWFDMWGGWFSHPRLLEVLRRSQELGREAAACGAPRMERQVCVIVDETLCFWDASFGALTREIIDNRLELPKAGAPHDLYLRTDWDRVPWEQYRVVWLLGFRELSAREQLRRTRLSEQGAAVLWTGLGGTDALLPSGDTVSHDGKVRFSASELRALYGPAGVHLYLAEEDILYAGHGWVGIHSETGGRRVVRLPFTADVTDAFANEAVAMATRSVTLLLPPRSTTLLRIIPAD